jgi:DNA (cytosine-5)-methyltransferase 1
MKFIELFAGVGAFRLGLERTGHECVWANEWLERPRSIYARNFGEQPDGRDIRTISAGDIPSADLIVGGFPCATFSIAGKRTGFSLDDTRGTLAFEMFRLARDKGIPYILFENVKGLFSNDGGRTFQVILETLDGMGYDCQWELLDSQNFGVPQHRERVFLIANLRGKPRPKVFPIGETGEPIAREGRSEQRTRQGFFSNISPTLDAHYYKGGGARQYVIHTESRRDKEIRNYVDGVVPTLTAQMGTGGGNVPYVSEESEKESPDSFKTVKGFHITEEAMTWDIYNKRTRSISPTLLTPNHNSIRLSVNKRVRKLTPVECERLQGLPDGWTEFYHDGRRVSDSERYERCGRTITISVVEAIGRKLHEFY